MAEVKAQGHDCVITIGGIQSNHCRCAASTSRLRRRSVLYRWVSAVETHTNVSGCSMQSAPMAIPET
jgi:1-aminocyclopropane-1-carboxylate deaminase/D-cysteine desulfhydrase-like pyridoxal-dependent ACC family enzyme